MEYPPQGYLHDKLDVKLAILFILARIDTPLSGQEIYEIAYQDDSLNYFTFAECLPELVDSGHLRQDSDSCYTITQKGREQGSEVESSLAVPLVRKLKDAISQKLTAILREGSITTEVKWLPEGYWVAALHYQDDGMPLMDLRLMAPSKEVAAQMARRLRKQADALYKLNLDAAITSGTGGAS